MNAFDGGVIERPVQRVAPAVRWSWKLATVAGIDVYVHGTFLLLISFVALSGLVAGQGISAMVRGTLLILAVFTTVVLHELGHALTARRFGVRTRDITLFPIGGVARLEGMPEKPVQQLLVALAGPAVNVAIALVFFGVVRLLYGPVSIEGVRHASGPFLTQLMWINVSLAAFNLLPGYPMDGGRVLRALLAMRMAPERATQLAARVGQGVAVIFGLVGLFWSPLLIVIAVFVWLGAKAEHTVSTVKVALAGVTVRQGMVTDYKTLSPGDPLSRALGGAMTRMHQSEGRSLMVVENGNLLGLLTVGNIGELLALAAAGRQTAALVDKVEG